MNGASNSKWSEVGLILANLDGDIVEYMLRLNFNITNNGARYEALIYDLMITKELEILNIKAFFDSQVLIKQIWGKYEAKDPSMAVHLHKIKDISLNFKIIEVQ